MTETIRIEDIDVSKRLRPVDPHEAELIAASIEQRGLSQPVLVRKRSEDDGPGLPYVLIVGGHRTAAVQLLGWKELAVDQHVRVLDVDAMEARLIEIDENIARNELNALDRALFLLERKSVYEEMRRVHSRGGDRKSTKFKELISSESFRMDFSERFTEDAAKRTGYSESAIQKAIMLARRLDKDAIAAIRGTPLENNQNELFQLAELPDSQQRDIAQHIKSGEAKSVVQAKIAAGLAKPTIVDPQARILAALLENWEKASKPTKVAFLKMIGAEMSAKKRAGTQAD